MSDNPILTSLRMLRNANFPMIANARSGRTRFSGKDQNDQCSPGGKAKG